jgi:hypothetical protein
MATARGAMFWYFDGAHRNVTIVDARSSKRWMVPLNQAPGFQNPEVYHPRWTNHPRFIALSGPYNQGGANQVRSGGKQSEVWLGRFSDNYATIEAWTRVTNNSGGDSYPDVWMDTSRSPSDAAERTRRSARFGNILGQQISTAPAPRVASSTSGCRTRGPSCPAINPPYRHALVVNEHEIARRCRRSARAAEDLK